MVTIREVKERYGLAESVTEDEEDTVGDTLPEENDGRSYGISLLKNVPGSAAKFAKDTITPLLSPIETAKSVTELGKSLISLIRPGEQGNEELARSVGAYYKERYGENFAESLRTDPIGVLGDVAIFLNVAGGTAKAATKAAGVSQKVQKGAGKVSEFGRNIDHLSITGRAAGVPLVLGARAAGTVQGLASGTGRAPLDEIASGSEPAIRAMRGDVTEDELLIQANRALDSLKKENSKFFQKRKDELFPIADRQKRVKDKTKSEIKAVLGQFSSKFRVKNQTVDQLIKTIENDYLPLLDEVKTLDDLNEFRAAYYDIDFPAPTSKKAQGVYSQTRKDMADIINKEMPAGYQDFLTEYGKQLDIVDELQRELGIGSSRSKQAVINKLQRAARDEGSIINRILKELGDPDLVSQLLGIAVNPKFPGGLARSLTAGAFGAGLAGLGPSVLAPAIGGLLAVSPRAGGEAALIAGRLRRGAQAAAPTTRGLLSGSRQVGALQNENILNQ